MRNLTQVPLCERLSMLESDRRPWSTLEGFCCRSGPPTNLQLAGNVSQDPRQSITEWRNCSTVQLPMLCTSGCACVQTLNHDLRSAHASSLTIKKAEALSEKVFFFYVSQQRHSKWVHRSRLGSSVWSAIPTLCCEQPCRPFPDLIDLFLIMA